MILRARLVLPVSSPPIEDGAVLVSGNRIRALGRWRELRRAHGAKAIDLGEMLLLPGLVNAHCHLDYTDMAGMFPPSRAFTDWLKQIVSTKAQWSIADYRQSWLNGAGMLLRNGVTTVADIEAAPQLLPHIWKATPLRVFSFLEMISITSRRQPAAVAQEMLERIASYPAGSRCRAGLSPHATYTTGPELLRLSREAARKRRLRLCSHISESGQEYEMFARGRGEMFDWLKRSGRDMADCGLGSPVQHYARCGVLGPNMLGIHLNYLRRGDARLLAKNRVSVVHCARSHSYFRHAAFSVPSLLRAGVNVCVGTDSLATVYQGRKEIVELNLLEDVRELAKKASFLSPRKLLEMVTLNPARALGMGKRIGELSVGAYADLIAIPFTGRRSGGYEAVVQHPGTVRASMIDGKWAFGPNSDERA
jgi:cytosine/adenosine deaminase-related metal-dependent hydrolase